MTLLPKTIVCRHLADPVGGRPAGKGQEDDRLSGIEDALAKGVKFNAHWFANNKLAQYFEAGSQIVSLLSEKLIMPLMCSRQIP
jgi:hypothetical protein